MAGEEVRPSNVDASGSFPALWARPDAKDRLKRTPGPRRPSADTITPFHHRLDASEWLEKLLSSLVEAEPSFGSLGESRMTEEQRIFQREALPSSNKFVRSQPTGKRRFSLASVRVNPNSLQRQFIYPTPNMALIQLESPVRFPGNPSLSSQLRHTAGSSGLQRPKASVRAPLRQNAGDFRASPPLASQTFRNGQNGSPVYSGAALDNSGYEYDDASAVRRKNNVLDVDLYLNYFP